ncbi:hypothetical protein [Pandoraea sp. ISTKB]|uniref:hypothetical protein n=1 Tax=Pandoraea sp. ISTKB TaxID=1586708 RepID=UPI0008472D94|nr:hypothetical protein [Pandoraea sp. ISTKB]ODP35135.1 hypothetical protein A9762_12325 [Pandoraea sp. ISTKB]
MTLLGWLVLVGGAVTLSGAVYVWNDRYRRVPLAEFGEGNVQRVGAWENPEWREKVWSRGWMTSAEWRAVNKRQLAAIDAELRRRGITPKD